MSAKRGNLQFDVELDARGIADLVKDGEHAGATELFRDICEPLALWEGLALRDRVVSLLNIEYPRWREDNA